MARSNVRRAVSSCVMCGGLMIASSAAVAAAERDDPARIIGQSQSGGSEPGLQHSRKPAHYRSEAQSQGAAKDADTPLRSLISGVTSMFGSGRVPGQQSPTVARPAPVNVATPVVGSIKDRVELAAPDPSTATTSDTIDPATANAARPVSTIDPPAADPGTPVADLAPPTVDVAPVVKPVAADPGTTPVVETAASVTSRVPAAAAVWPVSPITDVISSVQSMLTSVALTLIPIATDLGSLLGVNPWSPVVNEVRSDNPLPMPGAPAPAFAAASVPSPLSDFPRVGAAGLSLKDHGELASAGTVATIGATKELKIPVEVPLPQIATIQKSVKQLQQFFSHAVKEVLRSPSLSALAALALPGIVGLFVITGAGIRFGYRQANAMLALPASGLARYAPPQPLQLVRSKHAVTTSRPAMRFVHSEVWALRTVGPPLESAA